MVCDGDEVWVYRANIAGTGATAGQTPSAWHRMVFLSAMAPSCGLHWSLHGVLVVVATVAMVMMVMMVMATATVMRWWGVMETKRGCTWPTTLAPAQLLNSSPALRLCCEANKSASLAGLTEKSGGRGSISSGNAPASPVSPVALGLAGTVVNADRDGKSNPWALRGSTTGHGRCTCHGRGHHWHRVWWWG